MAGTLKDRESAFVKEIRESYGELLKREQYTCPLCGGKLVRRSGPYGDFFGCANYKQNGCKYKRQIAAKKVPKPGN